MGRKSDNCPHCNLNDCIPSKVYSYMNHNSVGHVEVFNTTCIHCEKKISVRLNKYIVCNGVYDGHQEDYIEDREVLEDGKTPENRIFRFSTTKH